MVIFANVTHKFLLNLIDSIQLNNNYAFQFKILYKKKSKLLCKFFAQISNIYTSSHREFRVDSLFL